MKGVNDPIEEEDHEEPDGSAHQDSASIHQSKKSGKSIAKSGKMKVNFNGMPSVMSN